MVALNGKAHATIEFRARVDVDARQDRNNAVAGLLWHARYDRFGLAAAHRRHRHLIAPAGPAVELVAGAELQILAHADAHFAQPRAVAGYCDSSGGKTRI